MKLGRLFLFITLWKKFDTTLWNKEKAIFNSFLFLYYYLPITIYKL